MKFIYQLTTATDFTHILNSKVDEVILCSSEFSRFGELSLSELVDIAKRLKEAGKRVVLCFDILMTENIFILKTKTLSELDLALFDAVRVQDPGALEFFRAHECVLPIQLILETGNHNTRAVNQWASVAGERLERLILSLEWPRSELFKLLAESKHEFELMGLGPILLFYSPRSLVRPLVDSESDAPLNFFANSEESPHKGFRVLENKHGTFMFHPKHHGLLEESFELAQAGLAAFRLELTNEDERSLLDHFARLLKAHDEQELKESVARIKEVYPHTLIKGFYKANKSNVLFKKLKNDRLSARSELLIGHVLDYKKGHPLLIKNLHPTRTVRVGESLRFLSTEGKQKEVELTKLKNLHGDEVSTLAPGELGLFPFVGSMSVKSQVFWAN